MRRQPVAVVDDVAALVILAGRLRLEPAEPLEELGGGRVPEADAQAALCGVDPDQLKRPVAETFPGRLDLDMADH